MIFSELNYYFDIFFKDKKVEKVFLKDLNQKIDSNSEWLFKIKKNLKFFLRKEGLFVSAKCENIFINGECLSENQKLKYGDIITLRKISIILKAHFPYGIVTVDPETRNQISKVEKYAKFEAPIMIVGETGTGKELIAKALHDLSPRKKEPYIQVNCAELSPSLAPSKLFGHMKGAFTGAVSQHLGVFEAAHKGSLFLDEFGELDEAVQSMILRVTQSGELQKVGCNAVNQVDVRVITATNLPIYDTIYRQSIGFRDDLYYRLGISQIILPPLKERECDIEILLNYFLNLNKEKFKLSPTLRISKRSYDCAKKYNWPGNIRELKNIVYDAVMTQSDSDEVEIKVSQPLGKNSKTQYNMLVIAKALKSRKTDHEICNELKISRTTLWRYKNLINAL